MTTQHPVYKLQYVGSSTVPIGGTGPIAFILSRNDGLPVQLSSARSLVITLPGGGTEGSPPTLDEGSSVPTQLMPYGATYNFPSIGEYTIKAEVSVTPDIITGEGTVTVVP